VKADWIDDVLFGSFSSEKNALGREGWSEVNVLVCLLSAGAQVEIVEAREIMDIRSYDGVSSTCALIMIQSIEVDFCR